MLMVGIVPLIETEKAEPTKEVGGQINTADPNCRCRNFQ